MHPSRRVSVNFFLSHLRTSSTDVICAVVPVGSGAIRLGFDECTNGFPRVIWLYYVGVSTILK